LAAQKAAQNPLKTAEIKSCLKQKDSFQSDSQLAVAPTSKASNSWRQSELHHQRQNPAERHWQTAKHCINVVLD
jgi:hypothetical protein